VLVLVPVPVSFWFWQLLGSADDRFKPRAVLLFSPIHQQLKDRDDGKDAGSRACVSKLDFCNHILRQSIIVQWMDIDLICSQSCRQYFAEQTEETTLDRVQVIMATKEV
jgi:hypothetical protein